ncbi:MAG: hypothetical protein ACAH88_00310 [Roseimicrobium sp.]
MKLSLSRRLFLALAVCVCAIGLPLVHATVDEAHDYAMEAATPFVEQGFTVREDYWNGEVENAQKLAVRHQLFKGNEYAFWLGTAVDDAELELAVFDVKGQPVHMERKATKHSCSVRVNPPKTGTYTVVFSVKSKKEKGVTWALAYGYR